MKKIITQILGVIFCAVALYSAPLQNVPQSIILPDGTTLECLASGDEYYNWLHDSAGYTIIQNPHDGFYYYAIKSGDTLIASNIKAGNNNALKRRGITPYLKFSPKKIKELHKTEFPTIKHFKPIPKQAKSKETTLQVSTSSALYNLVVFIRFSDSPEFTNTISTFDNMFNSISAVSMRSYYTEASYNAIDITSTFYPTQNSETVLSYQDSYSRNYYMPYSSTNTIGYNGSGERASREQGMLNRALNAIAPLVPPSLNIDNDNDGCVDNVCFIIYGNTAGWSQLLWPHMWQLYLFNNTINGKYVWNYNFQLATYLTDGTGASVLCHEMFHTLGAPDLYRYDDSGVPVGPWDLMAYNTIPPQHMTAHMKTQYGRWITIIPEITSNGTYQLSPLASSTNNCYKIPSPNSSTEYFMVEYRKKTGMFETGLYGSGLLVYRVNTSCVDNGNMDGPPDELYVFRQGDSDSYINYANLSSDVGRTVIGPLAFSDGSSSGITISNIGSSGETISFKVTVPDVASQPYYPSDDETMVSRTPLLCWKAGNNENMRVQVSSDINFSSCEVNSVTTNTYYEVTEPLLGSVYYWRVGGVKEDNTINWSDYSTFTVVPANTKMYFCESFEGSSFPPAGWSNTIVNGNEAFEKVSTGTSPVCSPQSGTKMLRYNSEDLSASSKAQLLTPVFTCPLTADNTVKFSMYRDAGLQDYVDFLKVYAVTTAGESTLLGTINRNNQLTPVASVGWHDYSFAIPAGFSSNTGQIVFEATSGNGQNIFIDNIKIYGTIIPLGVPELLSPANNLANAELSGTFSFQSVNMAANYEVIVSKSEYFIDPVFHSYVTSGTLDYSDFEYSQTYYWKVRALNDLTTSEWSEVRTFTTKDEILPYTHIEIQALLQGLWDGMTHKAAAVIIEFRTGLILPISSLYARFPAIINSEGVATLDIPNMPAGNYWLVVRASGYLPICAGQRQAISPGATLEYDFSRSSTSVPSINMLSLYNGRYVMRVGELNGDKQVNSIDAQLLKNNSGTNASIPD